MKHYTNFMISIILKEIILTKYVSKWIGRSFKKKKKNPVVILKK